MQKVKRMKLQLYIEVVFLVMSIATTLQLLMQKKTKKGRFDYNWKNCLIARDLFQNQIGVEVKYWCEKEYVR